MFNESTFKTQLHDIIMRNSQGLNKSELMYKKSQLQLSRVITEVYPNLQWKKLNKSPQKPLRKPKIKDFKELNQMVMRLDENRKSYTNNITSEMRVSNFVQKVDKLFIYRKELKSGGRLFYLCPEKMNFNFYLIVNCFMTNDAIMDLVRWSDIKSYFKKRTQENPEEFYSKIETAEIDFQRVQRVDKELSTKFPFSYFQKRFKKEVLTNLSYNFYRKALKLDLPMIISRISETKLFTVTITNMFNYIRHKLLNRPLTELKGIDGLVKPMLSFFETTVINLDHVMLLDIWQ